MGFIHWNYSAIVYNITMISFNMLETARINGVKRFFYAPSASIYPEFRQWKTTSRGRREKAPAAFCRKAIASTDRFEMWGDRKQTRSLTFIDECVEDAPISDLGKIGSSHVDDIFSCYLRHLAFSGPYKIISHSENRLFWWIAVRFPNTFLPENIEPVIQRVRLYELVNIGGDEMVGMNEVADIVLSFENKKLHIHNLSWAPMMKLKVTFELF
ncbi:hypothetical protein Nepgr_013152 [Nepenthes gracilis]|uniref:Uncharacterized protein n=1 Tax=Nepenthes gracilis TaxID=150966 RepID=A0AAD3XP09_NEPGR|nr:hypothetical protein Nepgr_013152 [Nepenthes gracilis]